LFFFFFLVFPQVFWRVGRLFPGLWWTPHHFLFLLWLDFSWTLNSFTLSSYTASVMGYFSCLSPSFRSCYLGASPSSCPLEVLPSTRAPLFHPQSVFFPSHGHPAVVFFSPSGHGAVPLLTIPRFRRPRDSHLVTIFLPCVLVHTVISPIVLPMPVLPRCPPIWFFISPPETPFRLLFGTLITILRALHRRFLLDFFQRTANLSPAPLTPLLFLSLPPKPQLFLLLPLDVHPCPSHVSYFRRMVCF